MTDSDAPRENRTVRTADLLAKLFPGRDLTTARPVDLGDGNLTPAQTAAFHRNRAENYHLANTPARYARANADHPKVLDWAAAYLRDMHATPWLLLAGDVGTGKTHQAYGALRYLATSGWPVIAWRAINGPDLYARLRPGSGTDPEAAFAELADAPLLLLDDLGATRLTEFTEEMTYRLINHRYNAGTGTIVTTNVAPAAFTDRFGKRTASRLREMSILVDLGITDRRTAPGTAA